MQTCCANSVLFKKNSLRGRLFKLSAIEFECGKNISMADGD
jgi:hypothetical protein